MGSVGWELVGRGRERGEVGRDERVHWMESVGSDGWRPRIS